MYAYIHKDGCGGKAFNYSQYPIPGQVFRHEDVTLIDGSKPDPMHRMVCGTCGEQLGLARADYIEGAPKITSVWHHSRPGGIEFR